MVPDTSAYGAAGATPEPVAARSAGVAALSIRRAADDPADIAALAPLFDAYRRFYAQPADLPKAHAFIADRLARADSVLFLAQVDGAAAGFCQLYPTWCSVGAGPIFVLYDLFVADGVRRGGVGRALMRAAQDHARVSGALRLDLSTARDNHRAQALYESLGWQRDDVYFTYSLAV